MAVSSLITDTIFKRKYESKKVSDLNLFDTCTTLIHVSQNKKRTNIIIHTHLLRNLQIASAKSRSARGASCQPVSMDTCLTISHMCLPCLLSR